MSGQEEKRKWEDEVIEKLAPERDKLQDQLNEIRDLRMNISLASRDKRREYLMKVGELSLIVGAAITPVIIVADSDVQFQSFAIIGVGLYLLNGVLALWRCKTLLYQDAEDAPQVGLDQEIMLEPIIHAYNKILLDPSSSTYQDEYKTASKGLLDKSKEIQAQKQKVTLDFWADTALYGFVLATLFVARTIWPFASIWYWQVLLSFALLVCILLLLGYRNSRKSRAALSQKHELLLSERTAYQEWHDKEVFK
ncbi:MAG TPA: hypothetical protein VLG36_04075 [Candidatus Chromulinivoraceae bacterium]|nr:hypothetical protein [Candidatus Chromulinivoraceae bacterium]